MRIQKAVLMSTAAAGLMLFTTGCATKRHVRAAIAPVENRVGAVEKRTTQAEADVDALEKQLSQTTEIANGAEREAKLAKAMAATADGKAVAAGQRADGANALAEKSLTRISEVETTFGKSIDNLYENLDNYQMSRAENITFAFNKADITENAERFPEIQKQVPGALCISLGAMPSRRVTARRCVTAPAYVALFTNASIKRSRPNGKNPREKERGRLWESDTDPRTRIPRSPESRNAAPT